ncbi:MAG: hypothetical protein J6W27_03915 [Alphaproteobacteria bacterium]|nr:hypothetical protein [Alphaproteobacteria bacterium]
MKKGIFSVLVLSMVAVNAFAADNGRASMFAHNVAPAPTTQRYTASVNQLNSMSIATGQATYNTNVVPATQPEPLVQPQAQVQTPPPPAPEPQVDMREAERNACINNNIGMGNTFVWASKYSNTSNYANMVEDVTNPQNNVCFVKVDIKSNDESRISASGLESKYFVWGENIECGSWVDKNVVEKRILDAKKSNRVTGIVLSSVGGAAVGVGAMELFGNKLIGGKVQGQKALSEQELYRSQLLVMKEKNPSQYNRYVENLKTIKQACAADPSQSFCSDYAGLINEFAN